MRSSIWLELLSKNLTWNCSIRSFGMGLSIRRGGSVVGNGGLAISVFGGIVKCMGR